MYQGSISGTNTHLTCPKCSKNYPGECLVQKKGCFMCGHSGHRLRDYASRHGLGGGNGRFQSKTSSAPTGLPSQQYKSSSIGGGQRQNRLYALQARQDEEGSLYVFIGTVRVFDLDN